MAKQKPNKSRAPSSHTFENFKFEPMTQAQSEAAQDFDAGHNLVLSGYAGTGKTHLACAFALEGLMNKQYKKIQLFRSAVSTRDIGHLPGTEEQKLEVYEKGFRNTFNSLLNRGDGYAMLKTNGSVNFNSTSFERGVTYNNTIVIVDECQNLSRGEVYTLATRLGKSSRIIFCGDFRQCDLRKFDGMSFLMNVAESMPDWFAVTDFSAEDIVRSPFVKEWIIRSEEFISE